MTGLKLWIDDLRPPPDHSWDWVTTSEAAIALMENWRHFTGLGFNEISFDHDLGGDDTSRPVVIWMIENKVKFIHYHVHSANPVGAEWLRGMIEWYLV